MSEVEKCEWCNGNGKKIDESKNTMTVCLLCSGTGYKSSLMKHMESCLELKNINKKYKLLLEFVKYHAFLNLDNLEIIRENNLDEYQRGRNDKEFNIATSARHILKEIGEL